MKKLWQSSESNILSLLIIALLIFVPLYPKFPLFNVPGTYVAIRIEDFFVAFTFLIWFFLEGKNKFPTFKNKISQLIVFYWGIGLLSLLSALLITKNITPHLAFLHFLRRIEYMGLFFVAYSSLNNFRQIKSYLFSLFLATIGVGVYAVGQKFFDWPVVSTMNEEFSKGMLLQLTEWTRVNSTFAGHYDLAAFLVMVLSITIGFIVGTQDKKERIFGFFLLIFAFYTLLLTSSRISFFAYLVAVIGVLIFVKKFKWIGPVLVFSLLGMVFSSDLGQRYALTFNIDLSFISSRLPKQEQKIRTSFPIPSPTFLPSPTPTPLPLAEKKTTQKREKILISPTPVPTVIERWRPSTEVAVEYSSGIRFKVEWPRAIRALIKNPFLGTGYSSITLATDNDYLRALGETGILGFFAFGLIFVEGFRQFLIFWQKRPPLFIKSIAGGIGGAVIGILINATFIDVFEASKVAFIFWILLGILIKMINLSLKKEVL
ncbi:MAG: O-antigen ligase family protein [Microgenomates group bacterium]